MLTPDQRSIRILYTEPVEDWSVPVDGGHLAFVRADAVLHIDGRPERHNIDYFTLIKQDGVWKFLTVSFAGRPVRYDWRHHARPYMTTPGMDRLNLSLQPGDRAGSSSGP